MTWLNQYTITKIKATIRWIFRRIFTIITIRIIKIFNLETEMLDLPSKLDPKTRRLYKKLHKKKPVSHRRSKSLRLSPTSTIMENHIGFKTTFSIKKFLLQSFLIKQITFFNLKTTCNKRIFRNLIKRLLKEPNNRSRLSNKNLMLINN
jgi:hypothetical protein